PSIAPIWVVLSPGSRSLASSCAPVTAASTTPTANAPRDPRLVGCSAASGGFKADNWRFRRRTIRPCTTRLPRMMKAEGATFYVPPSEEGADDEALATSNGELVGRPAGLPREPAADADPPHPAGGGRTDGLVVRLRQRFPHAPGRPDPHRHRPGAGVCA